MSKQFFLNLLKNKENVENDLIHDLYKIPKKNKGLNVTHYHTPSLEGIQQQADLLFLPNDNGYKYCLVVVDIATRRTAAIPLKSKTTTEVLNAFKRIYQSKMLKFPAMLGVDNGAEFKGVVNKYFKDNGVIVQRPIPFRHNSTVFVENANKKIGSLIHKYQATIEIITGDRSTEWVDILQHVLDAINTDLVTPQPVKLPKGTTDIFGSVDTLANKIKKREPVKLLNDFAPIAQDDARDLLPEGTKVRVALQAPKDVVTGEKLHGDFRSSDVRFERDPSTIEQIVFRPNNPPLYIVSGHERSALTKNELQPVRENEKVDTSVIKKLGPIYRVEKILDKRKQNRRWEYLIKWKYYDTPNWQPASVIQQDVPDVVKEFEAQLKNH